MLECPNCHTQNPREAKFCSRCGTALSAPVTPPSAPAGAVLPGGFRCVYCGSTTTPRVKSTLSTAGWIVFAILLVGCFLLAWIPFVVDGLKEQYRVCTNCGARNG